MLAGDPAPQLGVEVLRTGASALAGDGEAVAKHQHAEGQQVQRVIAGRRRLHFGRQAAGVVALGCGEVVLAGDVRLDISRRDARRGQAFVLDLFFNRFFIN